MRRTMALLIALIFATTLGCDSSTNGGQQVNPEHTTSLEDQLRSKPPAEAAQQQYRTAVTQMASQIAALVPGLTWSMDQDGWTDCGAEYVRTRGRAAYFQVGFKGPVPDEKWDQAVQIVKDGAKQFGANDFGVMKDSPGDHDVYVDGPDGVEFKFGTQVDAVLTARSDCRIIQTDTPTTSSTPSG